MQLNLSDAEVQALILALDSYYSDLREQIYHTEDYDSRQALKGVEAALTAVRQRLEPGWQAAPGYPADAGQGLPAATGADMAAGAAAPPGTVASPGMATPTTPGAAPQGTPPFGTQ